MKKTPTEGPQACKNPASARLFVKGLLQWNLEKNSRQMPWKGEKDAYKIWLSEIILQQTRVEQGIKYYEKFISTFPDVRSLADAPPDQVFKLWEGLGYYSRCRNLLNAAQYISQNKKGLFPSNYEEILQLKGVGSYTAAAIASFAYNLPHAVLDGNVFRVLSRVFGMDIPIDSSEGKKQFSAVAQQLLPKEQSAEYNQAIMDFGAVICKPVPECNACFFRKYCEAYLKGQQDILPVKEKKLKIRRRWLNYFVLTCNDEVLIHQRSTKDIWEQLYEFVLIETPESVEEKVLLQLFKKQYGHTAHDHARVFRTDQKLTHQQIHFSFIRIELSKKASIPNFFWAKFRELNRYAFPKTLKQFVVAQLK